MDKSIKQKEQQEGYDFDGMSIKMEKKLVPEHPYCTNWPITKEKIMDRFDLETEIQNVWHTRDDLDAIAERIFDDPEGPMTEDQLGNVLCGLSELHETRMKKLWKVFEGMIRQKNSFLTDEVTMGDVLDKIVDDAEKDEEPPSFDKESLDYRGGISLTEEETKEFYNRRPNESKS